MSELLERQVVVFQVGSDLFALDILQIREIARFQKVRAIPRAPDFLSGVIDLRGTEIVPIVDLHDRLALEPEVEEQKSRIIIAPLDGRPVGFLVDVVRDVIAIDEGAVEAPPAVGSAPNFLEGVIRTDDEIILLLDIGHILTSKEKLHMEELRSSLVRGDGGKKRGGGKGGARKPAGGKPSSESKSGAKSRSKSGAKSKSSGSKGGKKA